MGNDLPNMAAKRGTVPPPKPSRVDPIEYCWKHFHLGKPFPDSLRRYLGGNQPSY